MLAGMERSVAERNGIAVLCLEVLSIQFQAKGMLKGRPAVEHTVSFDS